MQSNKAKAQVAPCGDLRVAVSLPFIGGATDWPLQPSDGMGETESSGVRMGRPVFLTANWHIRSDTLSYSHFDGRRAVREACALLMRSPLVELLGKCDLEVMLGLRGFGWMCRDRLEFRLDKDSVGAARLLLLKAARALCLL